MPAAWEDVAALAATAADIAAEAGGRDDRGPEDEKWVAMHDST